MDRRIKYTKMVIKETFLVLLEEKDVSKITIKELCKKADINRATFYRYYLDIYDLLEKVEEELIDNLKHSTAVESIEQQSVYSFSKEILEILYENKKLVKILFNTNRSIYFLNDVLDVAYEKLFDIWSNRYPNADDEEIIYSCVFIFNGALGIINYWVKEDFNKDINYLAKSIEDLSIHGATKFIQNK